MAHRVEFQDKQPVGATFCTIGEKCHCTLYADEQEETRSAEEEGEENEATVWSYECAEFSFTPGKLLTKELIEANPETFIVLDGDVDSLVATITQRVQDYIDGWAQQRGYDNCFTAAGYKDSSVMRFQMEGTILAKLRDDCWYQVNVLENKAIAGDRTALSDLLYLPAGLPEPDFSNVPEI